MAYPPEPITVKAPVAVTPTGPVQLLTGAAAEGLKVEVTDARGQPVRFRPLSPT